MRFGIKRTVVLFWLTAKSIKNDFLNHEKVGSFWNRSLLKAKSNVREGFFISVLKHRHY
jgi:hypothetical protein